MLCDWGARVIKIEHPADKERQAYASLPGVDAERADQLAPLFALNSRGKLSVALDLKETSGRAALETLLSQADVFVSNLREAALERLDLGCRQLRTMSPYHSAQGQCRSTSGAPKPTNAKNEQLGNWTN